MRSSRRSRRPRCPFRPTPGESLKLGGDMYHETQQMILVVGTECVEDAVHQYLVVSICWVDRRGCEAGFGIRPLHLCDLSEQERGGSVSGLHSPRLRTVFGGRLPPRFVMLKRWWPARGGGLRTALYRLDRKRTRPNSS